MDSILPLHAVIVMYETSKYYLTFLLNSKYRASAVSPKAPIKQFLINVQRKCSEPQGSKQAIPN